MASVSPPTVSSPIHSLTLPHRAGNICDVAWSPSGTCLATVSSSGWVLVWKISTGELLQQKQVTRVPLLSVAWARGGSFLTVGCQRGILRMLDEQLAVRAVYPFPSPITRIAWSPHVVGACVIVAGQRVTVLREENQTMRVFRYQSAVLDAAWSGDGRQIAILCADGLVEIWHARTFRLTHHFHTTPMTGGSLFWEQGCRTMVVMECTGTVRSYPLPDLLPTASSHHTTIPPAISWGDGVGGMGRPVRDPSGRYLASPGPHTVLLYPVSSPDHEAVVPAIHS